MRIVYTPGPNDSDPHPAVPARLQTQLVFLDTQTRSSFHSGVPSAPGWPSFGPTPHAGEVERRKALVREAAACVAQGTSVVQRLHARRLCSQHALDSR